MAQNLVDSIGQIVNDSVRFDCRMIFVGRPELSGPDQQCPHIYNTYVIETILSNTERTIVLSAADIAIDIIANHNNIFRFETH